MHSFLCLLVLDWLSVTEMLYVLFLLYVAHSNEYFILSFTYRDYRKPVVNIWLLAQLEVMILISTKKW